MIEIQRIVHIQCIQFYEFGHRQTPMHHHNEDNRHIQHFPKFYWTPCLVLVVKTLNLSFTLNTFFFFLGHNTVLLALGIMLQSRSLEFFHLV